MQHRVRSGIPQIQGAPHFDDRASQQPGPELRSRQAQSCRSTGASAGCLLFFWPHQKKALQTHQKPFDSLHTTPCSIVFKPVNPFYLRNIFIDPFRHFFVAPPYLSPINGAPDRSPSSRLPPTKSPSQDRPVRKPRKSVAFTEEKLVVNTDGTVEIMATPNEEKDTALVSFFRNQIAKVDV